MTKERIFAILGVIVLVGLVVAGIAWIGTRPQPGEIVASQGNLHIDAVDSPHEDYTTKPPTSGPHIGSKARWGVSSEQLPDELQIHNLEDGGVIVHYAPSETDEEEIGALEDIVSSYSDEVILEPYADMDSKIVLTAWARIDRLDQVDETRIREFVDAYRGVDHH